jgi:hypothetical protein
MRIPFENLVAVLMATFTIAGLVLALLARWLPYLPEYEGSADRAERTVLCIALHARLWHCWWLVLAVVLIALSPGPIDELNGITLAGIIPLAVFQIAKNMDTLGLPVGIRHGRSVVRGLSWLYDLVTTGTLDPVAWLNGALLQFFPVFIVSLFMGLR